MKKSIISGLLDLSLLGVGTVSSTLAPVKVEAAAYHGQKRLLTRRLEINRTYRHVGRWVYIYSDGSVSYTHWFSLQ